MRASTWIALVTLVAGCNVQKDLDLVIRDVSVVDVEYGKVRVGVNIGIRDGIIEYVGRQDLEAEQSFSGQGFWAIPGLWDMHVHVSDPAFFPLFLSNGVVGIRDMGGAATTATDGCESIDIAVLRAWRDDIERGLRAGPRMVLAGPVLSGTGSSSSLDATTPMSARQSVAAAQAAGSDFIKVYEDIPSDVFAALAEEARTRAMVIAGHVSEETLTILEAIEQGQRSIEHVRSHLLLCYAESKDELELLYSSDDWDADDRMWGSRTGTRVIEFGIVWGGEEIWLTPTLAIQETLVVGGSPGFEVDTRRETLPGSILEAVVNRSRALRDRSADQVREVENWNHYIHRLVARAARKGARFLAGSDAACEGVIPGHSLHRELELLVSAGLSPLQALQAATLEPARYFERQDIAGQVREGYVADIVLVRDNPLEDISNTHAISLVVINGEVRFNSQDVAPK